MTGKQQINIGEDFTLPVDMLVGRCAAVLGIRGSGKTNTAAVVVEELLMNGYPLAIADIDGEYWGLKERYEVLSAGGSRAVDLAVAPRHGAVLAQEALTRGIPLILDMSSFSVDEMYELLYRFAKGLWETSVEVRRPFHLVIEEAHEFLPQGLRTDLKDILVRIALRGRKRGLGILVVSQRSAKVDKDVLTQAELLFLHKVVHPVDMRVYKEIIPWPADKTETVIGSLAVGECVAVAPGMIQTVKVRARTTFHAGFTPSFAAARLPKVRKVNAELLTVLKQVTAERTDQDEAHRLREQCEALRMQLAERDKRIEQLESELEVISRLRVELVVPEGGRQTNEGQAGRAGLDQTGFIAVGFGREAPVQLPADAASHLNRIKRRLLALNRVQRSVLHLLVSRYPSQYTYSQLSTWTGYSESTLYKNNLHLLTKIGVLRASMQGRNRVFRSDVRKFVADQFEVYLPTIGTRGLGEITAALSTWICEKLGAPE
ncbi:MAG: DUF87 domain-containing protein [Bacillota bacterium]|nr:DUF87 domain-containing protein [Bacillota bacterium]